FETIVAAGPRSALPHARPSDRPLRRGDLVLFDFGATVDGYCSDMTRTFVLGPAAEWQRDAHQAVAVAQEAATAALAAGVQSRDVDAAARETLRAAGLADRFGHGTGHGIGLEVHEAPRIYARSDDVLQAGSVVTVEPGVYLPGRGGIRIEDDVVVEEGGARVLTRFSRELVEL
ncbi:MAG: M24 family metallopeptidase, partial [Acidobacteriota bacterium]|nr:M24 family metallopeptidase [Acidobacteriota bacterium]